MRKLLIALFCLAFVSTYSQSVEEVIQKYSATMGGLDRMNKIKTARITGNFTAQDNDFPLVIQLINGRAVISEIDVNGNKVINAYKDGKGWKINPLAGITEATDATASELIELKAQTMMATPLMDYKARGHKVELAGEETIDGKKVVKVKLTTKDDGKVTMYFINATDYTLVKSASDRDFQGQTVTVESWYSNPKDIDGVKFFMNRSQTIDGQEIQSAKFETIEFDKPIDEKIFDKP